MLSSRMNLIDSSGIRKVFDLAAKLENPINLSIGQPDFDVSDSIKAAASEAIRAGKNRYTLTQGVSPLREALVGYAAREKGISCGIDQTIVTSGVSGGLVLAFLALFGRGDEVIIPDPYFVMYKHLLRVFDATPVIVDTYPDFKLTAARVEARLTPKTQAIIVGSPSNPTGVVMSADEWKDLISLARARNILLISDEIYDAFVYDEAPFSPGSLYENVLTLGGFSKSHGMTGWRLGYALGPSEIVKAMITLQQYTFVCAPSMAQEAGLVALEESPEPHRLEYRKKRDRMIAALSPKYRIAPTGGAFYLFPEAPGGNATEFCTRAITEKKLLLIPGNVFSEKDTHFRLSYAASDEMLDRGIEALLKLA
ncbi:MAG: aminotransferase class I/II-fold pyridoxal phosphate-dependent enzyme [Candidatus Hydrogenedentota bacterium]